MKTTINELKKYGIEKIYENDKYYFIYPVNKKEYPWPYNDDEMIWRWNKKTDEIELIGRLEVYEMGRTDTDKLLDVSEFIKRAS